MRKSFSMLLCVILCICLCTACGGNDNGGNENKPDDKVTEAPAATDAAVATPEPTATTAPTPTEAAPTATPTPTPIPLKDSYTAEDFTGTWYMLSGEVDGAAYTAKEENIATKLVIGNDMKAVCDELLWGTDSRVQEVQCTFIPADEENSSCVYGEFEDEEGYPESYTCYILEDGNMEFNHFFTYDMGSIPVNARQIFTRDASVYNEILDSVVLNASFIGYGVDNISKTIYDRENDFTTLGSASAPYLWFDEDRYWVSPNVAGELNDIFAQSAQENFSRIEGIVGALSQEEKQEIANSNGKGFMYLNEYFYTVRSDSAVFSGIYDLEGFLGGPHPDYTYQAINIDMVTEQEIILDDFCKDTDKLYDVLVEKLTAKYPDASFMDMENTLKAMINTGTLPFVIGYGGVDFYFAPTALASYADGLLTAEISYSEYEDLFKARYTDIPYDFAVATVINVPYFLDIDGDGDREELLLQVNTNDWGDYTGLKAFADGKEILNTELEEESYSLSVFFMQDDHGTYLFAETVYYSDDTKILGFKFNSDGTPEKTGSWLGSFERHSGDADAWTGEDEWVSMIKVNGPYSIVLTERNDLLGTKSVLYYCTVNENGVIETNSNLHVFTDFGREWSKVTTLRKLNAFTSDRSGNKGEEITISKDTVLWPYAAVGNTSIVFANTEGTEYYLVECDSENGSIGGKSSWELFSGLNFAD